MSDRCKEVLEAFDPVISIADTDNCNGFGSQELNDEKPYFAYEPQIENRFILAESARKKEKEDTCYIHRQHHIRRIKSIRHLSVEKLELLCLISGQ